MFKSPAIARINRTFLPDFAHTLLAKARAAWQRTRTINELNELSDAHLRDIGVDRREIGSIVETELARLRRNDLAWRE